MHVLMINGSPRPEGCTYTALMEMRSRLDAQGIDSELVQIGMKPIAGCVACNICAQTGECVFDDQVNDILDRLESISAIVVGSPVYYAGPTGQVCALLDRLFYSAGGRMAGKFGASVISCRRGGAASAFDRLNKYFTIARMPVVSSQYWNQVHGMTPEEVRQDLEGMQTMRPRRRTGLATAPARRRKGASSAPKRSPGDRPISSAERRRAPLKPFSSKGRAREARPFCAPRYGVT